jgi:hypothetical protein
MDTGRNRSGKCHDDTFDGHLAVLRREHEKLLKRTEPARIRWLAEVAVRLYPLVLGDESQFRTYCIVRGLARHGRTATMLVRCLVDDLGRKTRQRWADCIEHAYEYGYLCASGLRGRRF